MNGHERFHVMAVAYGLNALDPADEPAFAMHLTRCRRCRRTLDQATGPGSGTRTQRPVGHLPAELRRRVMLRVAAEPRRRPGRRRMPGRGGSRTVQVAAASLVVALASVAVLAAGHLRAHRPAAAVDPVAAALVEPGSRIVPLRALPGSTSSPSTSLLVVANGRLVVVPGGLPPTDGSHRYAIWRRVAPSPWSFVGDFRLAGGRPATTAAVLRLPGPAPSAGPADFALSREPAGPAHAVPTEPLLVSTG